MVEKYLLTPEQFSELMHNQGLMIQTFNHNFTTLTSKFAKLEKNVGKMTCAMIRITEKLSTQGKVLWGVAGIIGTIIIAAFISSLFA